MSLKLSVCVPVYNAARYIEPCARSLFGQTYEDMECIFVDDCSSDESVAILQRVLADYPARQSRTQIIRNDRNRGPVVSRKEGIRAATGDVLAFCDADDWIDEAFFEKLIDRMVASQADAVLCSFDRQFRDGPRFVVARDDDRLMSGNEILLNADAVPGFCSMWTKILRRSLVSLDEIEWPDNLRIAEDHCFTMQVLPRCSVVAGVSGVYYHYRMTPTSLTHARDIRRLIADYEQVYEILTRKVPGREGVLERRFLAQSILYWGTVNGLLSKRVFEHWRKVIEGLGGGWTWRDRSLWGQRLMRVAGHSYWAARLAAPIMKRIIKDEL